MPYPTLEQYNEALQHPHTAFVDGVLRRGNIATTGLGLPLAMCGGFALTYTVSAQGKKFAVRCFHKQSNHLEERYAAISRRLRSLGSNYFLDFEFQSRGVRVAGAEYPVVKMAWASGVTLAEFVESNTRNRDAIDKLAQSVPLLSIFLQKYSIAHGDIQPENVMVSAGGQSIQLIDYDGMYLDDIKALGSAETGQRNFQHPGRTGKQWDASLDRFSLIVLYLALKLLRDDPELWKFTQSDQSAILFRASDYVAPSQSALFQRLFAKPSAAQQAKHFAAICRSDVAKVPTLEEFIAGKNIPVALEPLVIAPAPIPVAYASAYSVLDASDYNGCLLQVGNQVELIGRIIEVKHDTSKFGKPYIFVNFGNWKGSIVKLSIWSESLPKFNSAIAQLKPGQWVAAIGMIEPPYVSRRYGYSHLSINMTQASQLRFISSTEANYRLRKSGNGQVRDQRGGNQAILEGLRGTTHRPPRIPPGAAPVPPPVRASGNRAILDAMRGASAPGAPPAGSRMSHPSLTSSRQTPAGPSSKCFVATAVYGNACHPDVVSLREFRDRCLSQHAGGRVAIRLYERAGPHLARLVECSLILREGMRKALSLFVRLLPFILGESNDPRG